ncbi:MAG: S8 family serine peptidase [Hyphomicrobiales bacterium]
MQVFKPLKSLRPLPFIAMVLCCVFGAFHARAETVLNAPSEWLHKSVESACKARLFEGASLQADLPGAWFLSEEKSPSDQRFQRQKFAFALPDNHELRLTYIHTNGRLRRFTADIYTGAENESAPKPLMQAQADGNCSIRSARRILYEDAENIVLEQLDHDLKTTLWRETLQASWPAGRDTGGARIALIDSGLAYDLPQFRNRLARDEASIPIGYDFWDLDALPYDGDTARNVFQPVRHGTPVASIIAREAPNAALIPYRYPRPDMSRLGGIVEHAAKAGARIISMPLGSRKQSDWVTFEAAMNAHPEMLAIISAGNNGEDIDANPLWPSALDLDNIIVVTSSDAFGRLAEGSNWGVTSVDLMVPAENQPVVDFRGAKGRASGTSYAVPRIAALAARMLQKSPKLPTSALKAEIFARAAKPRKDGLVAVGWIIDPSRD